ncbi:2-oxo-4-hydroxy-4-carboxy-5-ureidoimidazoline decarboxylase [Pelomonas aquatica]|jgi:N-carbamoyl-L-amino-acid hydrolase|uniref:2-oxo-4-hydroxy-4-carboxy-5-ureidoimidazoline decarboxylase n=1 Tax=Pelomonas aquatica TaxID=431058 RepID=A0A9X4LKD3_9BURK|nr:2-oxo-4-hydroxy-4-carboxy-5-ureidoimidazoline decarboxylase [Pelomonas aquatica]MDG0865205.1 2-oxo-4-hydroxy-4-carboxy-5-ureidoimidazoline decarboxylase [Pelomonas aquatica]
MMKLDDLNNASTADFVRLLDGIYEHSPWIAERAAAARPFKTLAALKVALARVVREAAVDEQLGLIHAHPELAGKAAVAGELTAESTHEQHKAGLTACTPEEFARLQQLNADYNARFGWPFILAVRGPRGTGFTRQEIITTFERRLRAHPDVERAECLRQIHRIAEIRLNDKFGARPELGEQLWDWAAALAEHSEDEAFLTCTYATPTHSAVAAELMAWMRDCGFDAVGRDAVGNVVGVYNGTGEQRLLTGSHYDTVRRAGRFDGRLGIFVAMLAVRELHRTGRRLPFGLEVVGFSEEEGQRFPADFLGSSALIGRFDPAWLEQLDAAGITLRDAMRAAGLPGTLQSIQALQRDASRYLGFVEVHIEQGPVLDGLDLPLGIVTSINGSRRYTGEIVGLASHAGTTPMGQRRDAAAGVAELILFAEQRAAAVPDVVATVGMLEVPSGSINVIPGRCRFSLDLRATTDAARDALDADVLARLDEICQRRGLSYTLQPTLAANAAPSDAAWQSRWEAAVTELGLPVHRLPSGAGHDAMKLHELVPQAMLFVRGGNGGISHNPLESVTVDDAELAVRAFEQLLDQQ